MILIIAVIMGVVVGNFGPDAYYLLTEITSGAVEGVSITQIPLIIIAALIEDSEYLTYMMGNIGIGLLFAGLGVFSLLRKAGQEVAGQKYIVLE